MKRTTPVAADRERQLQDLQRRVQNPPPYNPLTPLTVDKEDAIIAGLKGERQGSLKFCEALSAAPPRVIIRAAKECVFTPETAVVNRRRCLFLLDHVVSVLMQEPKMELNDGHEKV